MKEGRLSDGLNTFSSFCIICKSEIDFEEYRRKSYISRNSTFIYLYTMLGIVTDKTSVSNFVILLECYNFGISVVLEIRLCFCSAIFNELIL